MNRIVIAVNPARLMRWQQRLRERLAQRWPKTQVVLRLEAHADDQPASITQLLTLERMILLGGRQALSDRLLAPQQYGSDENDNVDVLVDLTGKADTARARITLRPLYDGHGTDQAAIEALLAGAAPTLVIEDAATGEIAATGLPSLECERALTLGLDAVYSRIALLVEQAIAARAVSAVRPSKTARRAPAPYGYLLKTLAQRGARAIFHLCCLSPHWRVGWRYNDGAGLLETGTLAGPAFTPLYDRDMGFAADPFPIDWRGQTGVFFESMDYRSEKGAIKFQRFGANGPVGEPVTCIEEPWHLSYPFLIEQDGELLMIPEASLSGAITLYRCIRFPDRWEAVAKLVDNVEAADATIFQHGGRYWMTSVVRDGYGGYSDTLAIHHATSLLGPWRPHAQSPALVDARYARPAGAVVSLNGALLRPAQDCSQGYGKGIGLMRIDTLDPEHFSQSLVKTVYPGNTWGGGRLHTINRMGRLEVIDGAIFAPKYLPLRRIAANYLDSKSRAPDEPGLPAPVIPWRNQ